MILTVTLNPSVDRAIYLTTLKLGDTNRIVRTETDAGGKGVNLSRIADELGASTLATGFLGGGPGAFVRRVLDAERVPHDFIEIQGDTRLNISVEDESDSPPTTFNERGPEIQPAEWEALHAKCEELAPRVRWACLGGSVPPGLPQDIYRTLGLLFKRAGAKVLLDADGEPMKAGLEAKPDLVKPNAKESERLVGYPIESDQDALRAAREIRSQGVGMVILSRGEQGAVLSSEAGEYFGRSPGVEAHSTIGSGDSLLGAFLWALESNLAVSQCLRWGLAAGAATATTTGAGIGRQPTIERLLPMARIERA